MGLADLRRLFGTGRRDQARVKTTRPALIAVFAGLLLVACGDVGTQPAAGTGGATGNPTGGELAAAGGSAAGGSTGAGGKATGGVMGSGGAVSGRGGAAATGGQAGSATGGAAGRAQAGGQSGAAGAGAGGSPAAIPSCQSLGWTFTTATGCSVYSPAIGGNWQGLYQGHPCLQGCVNQNEHYYATQNCTDTRIDPGADSICVVDCSICQ